MNNLLTYQNIKRIKLENGMEVIFLKDHSTSIYVQLDINFGSLDLAYEIDGSENELAPGIAHFLEHKIFAMENGEDAFSKLTGLGLQANAMTSYKTTSYTLIGNENMLEGIIYLLEMIDNPYFTDENIEQEYNIISEEIRMYDDDVDSYIQNIMLNMLYYDNPIKHDIAGTIENIEFITKEMLLEAYDSFYQPNNRRLYISGNFDFDVWEKTLMSSFMNHNINKEVKKIMPYENSEVKEKFKTLYLPNITNKLSVGIKFTYDTKDKLFMLKEEIKAVMALNLLIGSLSEFYQMTLDEGLLTEQISFQLINEENTFAILLQGDTNDIDTLDYMLKKALISPDDNVFIEDTLEKIKKILIGHHIFSINEFEYKLYLFTKYDVLNVSLDSLVSYINEVTLDDIRNFMATIEAQMFSTLYVYSEDEN